MNYQQRGLIELKAISKAEAINRISSDTGVRAVVGKTVLTGVSMEAGVWLLVI